MASKLRKRRQEREALYRARTYRSIQRRLAVNVARIRAEKGWTQEEAAHRAGMSTRLYQRIEGGDTNASLVTLARLVDGFSASIVDLFR